MPQKGVKKYEPGYFMDQELRMDELIYQNEAQLTYWYLKKIGVLMMSWMRLKLITKIAEQHQLTPFLWLYCESLTS